MLNNALRLVRIFHRFNQSALAEKLEISRSYLSEIESGKKSPSIELLDKYSHIFDMPTSSFLLFSEHLEKNTYSERVRVKIAKKVIHLMDWIADTGVAKDGTTKKNA